MAYLELVVTKLIEGKPDLQLKVYSNDEYIKMKKQRKTMIGIPEPLLTLEFPCSSVQELYDGFLKRVHQENISLGDNKTMSLDIGSRYTEGKELAKLMNLLKLYQETINSEYEDKFISLLN